MILLTRNKFKMDYVAWYVNGLNYNDVSCSESSLKSCCGGVQYAKKSNPVFSPSSKVCGRC